MGHCRQWIPTQTRIFSAYIDAPLIASRLLVGRALRKCWFKAPRNSCWYAWNRRQVWLADSLVDFHSADQWFDSSGVLNSAMRPSVFQHPPAEKTMTHFKFSFLTMFLFAGFMAGGCASGLKHATVADSIPAIDASTGEGRVYFYRDGSPFGFAVQTTIHLNEEPVGKSKAGGFFFVDVAPGTCVVSCKTEAEYSTSFELAAGETKYVRTRIELGAFVGRIVPYVEIEEVAMKTLPSTVYIGDREDVLRAR